MKQRSSAMSVVENESYQDHLGRALAECDRCSSVYGVAKLLGEEEGGKRSDDEGFESGYDTSMRVRSATSFKFPIAANSDGKPISESVDDKYEQNTFGDQNYGKRKFRRKDLHEFRGHMNSTKCSSCANKCTIF